MKDADYLRRELKNQGISQRHFADQYFNEEVVQTSDDKQLVDHFERFKSLLKSSDPRSPERIIAYINFFDRRYKNESHYTQADRAAAWDLFIELDTRIATRDLNDGDSKSALASLAILFTLHRDISKSHGPNCKGYYNLVNNCFETHLRPFTSQWHSNLDIKSDEQFRSELKQIQINLNVLKSSLEMMSL